MANLLDETTGPVNEKGRDVHVIERQIPITVGVGSILFEIALWITIPIAVLLYVFLLCPDTENIKLILSIGCVAGLLPGVIFIFMKVSARNYFQQLEQKIQAEASNIDNFLEQRVQVLQNVVELVEKSIDIDKDVMKSVSALRSGVTLDDSNRSDINSKINMSFGRLFPQVEAYPDLKSQNTIADAMQQNIYLQQEITAARTVYNNRVAQWNASVFSWPAKMIVAARQGYTTRIPFSISAETAADARKTFFK